MTRLFLPPDILSADQITITGEQARYLSLVLRIKAGDHFTAFDGQSFKYECRVISSHKKEVIAESISKEPYSAESPLSITLAQGMPKASKMDLIVQKSTELGATRIIPLITERAGVKHTNKVDRWRKIALSAAQQSGRDRVPEITAPAEYKYFLKQFSTDDGRLKVVFYESKSERALQKILQDNNNTKNIILLIGPEGGFSKEEIRYALQKGFLDISLGPRILRTETAALTTLSIIQYDLGDIGQ